MEHLSLQHERTIRTFRGLLDQIVTVDDIFPPDTGGVREPRVSPQPRPDLTGRIALVAVTEWGELSHV